MSEVPNDADNIQTLQQPDFEEITNLVSAEFQIEEGLIEKGIPSYYLSWPQETKQAFLSLLKQLEKINFVAFLRKVDKRVVLSVVPKPQKNPLALE